eukprot:3941481-Rhodomonas_salina.3
MSGTDGAYRALSLHACYVMIGPDIAYPPTHVPWNAPYWQNVSAYGRATRCPCVLEARVFAIDSALCRCGCVGPELMGTGPPMRPRACYAMSGTAVDGTWGLLCVVRYWHHDGPMLLSSSRLIRDAQQLTWVVLKLNCKLASRMSGTDKFNLKRRLGTESEGRLPGIVLRVCYAMFGAKLANFSRPFA